MSKLDLEIKRVVVMFELGICPSCNNESTDDWCITCQKKNGIRAVDYLAEKEKEA